MVTEGFDSQNTEESPSRDIVSCPATWSPDLKGYIRVVHPTTGERVDIPYREATDVWKEDIRRLRRKR
jgi:hypothetical protein